MADINTSSYERMTVVELRALATTREIPFTTKTRKPELVALHQKHDKFFAMVDDVRNVTATPGQGVIAPLGTSDNEMPTIPVVFEEAPNPTRHGAFKLDPRQMRLNYARQNTGNRNLTLEEALNTNLTKRQERAITKRQIRIFNGVLTESDFKKVSA
jgi:hypothetical protein